MTRESVAPVTESPPGLGQRRGGCRIRLVVATSEREDDQQGARSCCPTSKTHLRAHPPRVRVWGPQALWIARSS